MAYYDDWKLARISEAAALLKVAGIEQGKPPRREALMQDGWLSMLQYTVRAICNPLKRSWRFSSRELSFFSITLDDLLEMLHNADRPTKEELIELRLDCLSCHSVIARRLAGVRAIRKADSIEHFNQSKYVAQVTLEGLGIHGP